MSVLDTDGLPDREAVVWVYPLKQTVQYLLVSISFPYIHTRKVGHDEGPQLLVVGELE